MGVTDYKQISGPGLSNDVNITSFNPTVPMRNVDKDMIAAARHGRRNGCSMKRKIFPKTFGHLLTGLLNMPPINGLQKV